MEHRRLFCAHCTARLAQTTCRSCQRHICGDCSIEGLCFDCYRRQAHGASKLLVGLLVCVAQGIWSRRGFVLGLTVGLLLAFFEDVRSDVMQGTSARTDYFAHQASRLAAVARQLERLEASTSKAGKALSDIHATLSCDLTRAVWRSRKDPRRSFVNRWLARHILRNPNLLASSARIVPSLRNGKPEGFKLYAIRPCSIYEAIGLENGDTILRINDIDITSPDKALLVYGALRERRQHQIRLRRGQRQITLAVMVVD